MPLGACVSQADGLVPLRGGCAAVLVSNRDALGVNRDAAVQTNPGVCAQVRLARRESSCAGSRTTRPYAVRMCCEREAAIVGGLRNNWAITDESRASSIR
jgi:hypothetical protein